MVDIRCLICNRVNDSSAERCWYCKTLLPGPSGFLTKQEREKLANIRKSGQSTGDVESPRSAEEKPQVPLPVPDPEQEDVPDWLARIRRLKQQDELTDKPDQRDWVEEEEPDWLRKLAGGTQQPASHENEGAGYDVIPTIDDSQVKPAPQIDQTNGFQEELSTGHSPKSEPAPFKSDIFSDVPDAREPQPEPELSGDWSFLTVEHESSQVESDDGLAEEIDKELLTPESEPDAPFPIAVDDLPDWLSKEQRVGDQQEKDHSDEGRQIQASERKLEKAHLPAWLASLRPIQSVIQGTPSRETQRVKTDQGILAGIQGTLPAIDSPEPTKVPRVFGQELRASPTQRKNAELFQSLLVPEEDNFPEGLEKPSSQGDHKLVRFLVTILVLLSVFIPTFSPSFQGVLPALYSNEVVDALAVVQSLPADRPVLITAHFEAGLAGEIKWAAQPVLKHLVSRNIPMALTSTNVIGFAVLQDLVSQVVGEGSDYKIDKKVVDLGYLPGGTIGLGALVNDPLAALPFTSDIQPVGEVKVLKGVTSLADFGALILITDNPEYARMWVEQIAWGDTPVSTLAVVSAQAAPMIQPYFYSGQVSGYVSGISGALSYELLRAAPGAASVRFSVYQVTLLVAAVIILAGGIISMIVGSTSIAGKGGKR